ncbi:MAG: hypothetical protein ACRDCK_09500, partial [Plesiomonas shigelloides]
LECKKTEKSRRTARSIPQSAPPAANVPCHTLSHAKSSMEKDALVDVLTPQKNRGVKITVKRLIAKRRKHKDETTRDKTKNKKREEEKTKKTKQ